MSMMMLRMSSTMMVLLGRLCEKVCGLLQKDAAADVFS